MTGRGRSHSVWSAWRVERRSLDKLPPLEPNQLFKLPRTLQRLATGSFDRPDFVYRAGG